jgi:hypothetical protein
VRDTQGKVINLLNYKIEQPWEDMEHSVHSHEESPRHNPDWLPSEDPRSTYAQHACVDPLRGQLLSGEVCSWLASFTLFALFPATLHWRFPGGIGVSGIIVQIVQENPTSLSGERHIAFFL